MEVIDFYNKCKENNLLLSSNQLEQLEQYYVLLVETNKVMNLTGITDRNEVYEKHFYDSVMFSFDMDLNNKSLVDVGTGAGFPGLVLAICYPNLNVTLVEPLTKRCNFLNKVIESLKLENVCVVNSRSEDFAKDNRHVFDFATARAVAKLNILLEIILPLVKINGCFVAMKARTAYEEIDEAKNALRLLNSKVKLIKENKLISNDDLRVNIFIEIMNKIDLKYPRNFSQIKKKPL